MSGPRLSGKGFLRAPARVLGLRRWAQALARRVWLRRGVPAGPGDRWPSTPSGIAQLKGLALRCSHGVAAVRRAG
jgi:hypothetical protein